MSLGRGFTLAPYCLLRAQGGRRSSGQAANDRQWTRLATRGARLAAAAVTGSLLLYVWRRGTREEAGQALTRVSGVDPLYHRVQSNAAPSRHGKGEKMQRGGRQGERFAGKVVVITGAAGDIGGATAAAFARERARLVLVDLPHTRPALEAQSGQLEASGADRAVVFTADVRREEDVQAMVAYTLQIMGPISCLFNNAGIQGQLAPVQIQNSEMFQKVIEVNVVGVFLCLKHVSVSMVSSGGGVIVNTASVAGMLGPRNMAAYAASKHAVVGLTKTAAKDLARHGVRVCAVAPGLLEGRMWGTTVEGQARCKLLAATGEDREVSEDERKEMQEHMLAGTPLGRLGRLPEVAQAVLFLCSEDASYLTGTVLPVDGGRLP